MKAALSAGSERFEVKDVPDLVPPEGWGLVRVAACGICGSDVHVIQGEVNDLTGDPLGKTLGHEMSGWFVRGAGETSLKEGDEVSVEPVVTCGKCIYCCTTGQYYQCPDAMIIGYKSLAEINEGFTTLRHGGRHEAVKVLITP